MNQNFKKYISIFLTVCLLMALVSLAACKETPEEPGQTTPSGDQITTTIEDGTTPKATTPKETTPAQPTETVTFPSDEENDPKQEDIFFD